MSELEKLQWWRLRITFYLVNCVPARCFLACSEICYTLLSC
jgi:hypothetical protein